MDEQQHLASLTPDTRERVVELLAWARGRGMDVGIVSSWRSCDEQEGLFQAGTSKARGCRSFHTWGRAVDLSVPGWTSSDSSIWMPAYETLAAKWREMGGKWGGDYQDWLHYEYHPEVSYADLEAECPDPYASCLEMQGRKAPAAATASLLIPAAGMVISAALAYYWLRRSLT